MPARQWAKGCVGVTSDITLTPMTKTQVYLPDEELTALHKVAKRTGQSTAQLIREAIRDAWLRPTPGGPVALWSGKPRRGSFEHDAIYDEP